MRAITSPALRCARWGRTLRAPLSRAVVASGLAVALLASPQPAVASPATSPEPTAGVDGVVYASVQVGDRTFIGGQFSWAGPDTGAAVPVDASTGSRTGMPRVNGLVNASVADGSGGWFVGGDFVYAGGRIRNGAARLSSTGAVREWNPQPNGPVHALAVRGDVVYMGGSFSSVGGQPRNNIAAVDRVTGAVLPWNPGADGTVRALATSGSSQTVYAGGDFSSIGGRTTGPLAALDAQSGLAGRWAAEVNGAVLTLAMRESVLYAGGEFTTAGGTPRNHAAAFSGADGSLTGWSADVNGPVAAIAASSAAVYLGGSFGSVGGQPRANLAAVQAGSGEALAWSPNPDGAVQALVLSGDSTRLYVGGGFTSVSGTARYRAASFDLGASSLTGWQPNAEAAVRTVSLSGGDVLVGGAFDRLNGLPRQNAAAIRADGTVDPSWSPNPNGIVYALSASADGQTAFLGGTFTAVGPVARRKLAAVDTVDGAVRTAWKTTVNNTVRALTVSGDRLYVGGSFSKVAGHAIPRLGAVDARTGAVDSAFSPSPSGTVRALVTSPSGDLLYAGGAFTTIAGVSRPGIAELRAIGVDAGSATSFTPTDGGVVIAAGVTPSGGRVYFASTSNRTYAYDPRTGNTPVYRVRTGGDVQAIAVSATEVYIGGHFNSLPEAKLNRAQLASFRVTTGQPTDWNPGVDGPFGTWTITLTPTAVHVGGDFQKAGGSPQPGYARFPGAP